MEENRLINDPPPPLTEPGPPPPTYESIYGRIQYVSPFLLIFFFFFIDSLFCISNVFCIF